jgi:hypothetical protein
MVLGQVSVCGIYGFFTYNFFSMAKRQCPLTGKMVFCPLFGTDNVESHIWLDLSFASVSKLRVLGDWVWSFWAIGECNLQQEANMNCLRGILFKKLCGYSFCRSFFYFYYPKTSCELNCVSKGFSCNFWDLAVRQSPVTFLINALNQSMEVLK